MVAVAVLARAAIAAATEMISKKLQQDRRLNF